MSAAHAGCGAVALAAGAQARRPNPTRSAGRRRRRAVEVVGVVPFAGTGSDPRLLPYAVQTLDRDALREAQGGNLVETMARRLHGVNVNEMSGSPFQADLTYRGFRASPMLGTGQGCRSTWTACASTNPSATSSTGTCCRKRRSAPAGWCRDRIPCMA
jgi:outer membrane receptor protein involved in Fe transport